MFRSTDQWRFFDLPDLGPLVGMPPTAADLPTPIDEDLVSVTKDAYESFRKEKPVFEETVTAAVEKTPKELADADPLMQNIPTVGELRAVIPAECFEKSLPTSIAYMVLDFVIIAGLYKAQPYFEMFSLPGMLFWYFLMGMMGFAVFVVGHDCGHGTFSKYKWVNDIIGHICHGILLAPYWPWQKSHRLHHTYTSHLEKDHGHPWITIDLYETWNDFKRFYANNPYTALVRWYMYTVAGVTDGSHFWPFSRMFDNTTERIQCAVSGLVCIAWATAAFWYLDYSVYAWVKFYLLPVMSQGFWLTMVTYLQHQTEDIKDGTWGYVRGQLQTIDRPYGYGIDQLMHHITDGHVAHHLFFTQIPHYNLMKATHALQQKLAPLGVYRHEKSHDFLLQFYNLNRKLTSLPIQPITAAPQYGTVEGTQVCPRCGPLTFNASAISSQIFVPYLRPVDLANTVPICEVAKAVCSCGNMFIPIQLLTDVTGGMVLDLNLGSATRIVFCGLDGQWYIMQGTQPLVIKTLICYAYNPQPQYPTYHLPTLFPPIRWKRDTPE
ncbi:unnamed protein product, partial [Mesorhabditis spiculigera]